MAWIAIRLKFDFCQICIVALSEALILVINEIHSMVGQCHIHAVEVFGIHGVGRIRCRRYVHIHRLAHVDSLSQIYIISYLVF